MLSLIFKGKAQNIVNVILLILISILFISQFIYFQVFQTFYTIYSLGHGQQVLEFYQEIIHAIKTNLWYLPFYVIPLIFYFLFKQVLKTSQNLSLQSVLVTLLAMLLLHLGALGFIDFGPRDPNSPYQLYHRIHYPLFSVEHLGLLTTMRLDVQRLITHWQPPLEDIPIIDIEPDDEVDEPITYENNVLDIDFDTLIANESNKTLLAMHNYFKNVTPTAKNEFTGKYEGYNLIVLNAEAFSHLAVDPNLTPTLYKMMHEGYYFENFYTPIWGVSTSDGEYVANIGLIPKSNVWSFRQSSTNYLPFAMGNQLRKLDYATYAYHNHTYTYYARDRSHPNMGYIYKGVGNGLEVRRSWPESDLEMMEVSMDDYLSQQPFHAYYMTVSGHMNYNWMGNSMSSKNRHLVNHLAYSEPVKAYLAAQIELDRAMEYLLKQLEAHDLADKTLIVLSADHYPYGLEHEYIEELAQHPVDTNFELYRNGFILYTQGMEPMVISDPASSLDIIPTISNLLGLPYDSRLLMGRDLFSNSPPLVIFNNRSFISNKGRYNAKTRTFDRTYGERVDEDYVAKMNQIINAKFQYSAQILDMDYYRKILSEH